MMYNWNDSIPKFRNDIGDYLKRRYDDYCNYIDEKEGQMSFDHDYVVKRHNIKKNELIEFGIVLRKKLNFFLPESRKELFENIIKEHKLTENFFKSKFEKFCSELKEEYKYKSNFDDIDEYLNKEYNKKLYFLKFCELMKNNRFVENIDKRRAVIEKRMLKEDKIIAKEKIKRELLERRKEQSNLKPVSFYEEMYINDGAPFNCYDDYDELTNELTKYHMSREFRYEVYFQEYGKPKGKWVEGNRLSKRWRGDSAFSDNETEKYVLLDNPNDNQKFLERCKEMTEILLILKDSKNNQLKLFQVEILQKYLTKGYLITRQIASFNKRLIRILVKELSTNPYNPNQRIKNHPCKEYDFSVYKDGFDITKIKEDVHEFIRVNEQVLFTPFEMLKVYLKKYGNRITVKEYAQLIGESDKVVRKILYGFLKEKKLKFKQEGSSHRDVFYI